MSLTSHLRSPDSPVRRYLEESFPILEQSKRGRPLARELSSFLGFDKLPPCRLPTLAPKSHQGTIGTAADYRLRYYFQPFDAHETAAAVGISMLHGSLGTLGRKFLDHQNELVARLKPAEHQLNDHDEATLNTSCIILAFFEQIYRVGDIYPPLDTIPKRAQIADLIAAVQTDMVQDIGQLSVAFASDAKVLFNLKTFLNPVFQGSSGIGGADADIIVESTIIDFKCTSKADATVLRSAALQLLGYVLLDYDDEYGVSHIMVYLPRQRDSWRMPLWQLVLPPADVILAMTHKNTDGVEALAEKRLHERRKEFRNIVESL